MLEHTSSRKGIPFVVPKKTAICISHSPHMNPSLLILRDQAFVLAIHEARENLTYHFA